MIGVGRRVRIVRIGSSPSANGLVLACGGLLAIAGCATDPPREHAAVSGGGHVGDVADVETARTPAGDTLDAGGSVHGDGIRETVHDKAELDFEAEAAAALSRGIAWLAANQNDDGSWGSFESARPSEIYLGTVASHRAFRDATSALAVMALIPAATRGDAAATAALDRGVSYLLATEPSLRATGDTFYNVWTHTYLVQAAARLLASDLLPQRRDAVTALLVRELDLLRKTQAADGGWGYYDFDHAAATPSGDQTTSFNTASVLLALREAAAVGVEFEPTRIADALAVLRRLRLPSGAYIYGTYAQFRPTANFNMLPGSIGRSQPCNLALHLGGALSLEALLEGVEALRREHRYLQIGKGRPRPHEAYYQTSGYYYFYGHHYAAEAIALLPEPHREEMNDWMLGVIAGVQNPDGSWLDFPMYGYGKPYGTAFAVLTLERCLAPAAETSPMKTARPR